MSSYWREEHLIVRQYIGVFFGLPENIRPGACTTKSFTIVNYASVWSATYNRNRSFIVLATVITIVNYDQKIFYSTGHRMNLLTKEKHSILFWVER
jgi:hypothetical protein